MYGVQLQPVRRFWAICYTLVHYFFRHGICLLNNGIYLCTYAALGRLTAAGAMSARWVAYAGVTGYAPLVYGWVCCLWVDI